MEKAAWDIEFMTAARLRNEMFEMQKKLEGIKGRFCSLYNLP